MSSGSACTSASLEPSYVLRALGVEEDMAHTSIRCSGIACAVVTLMFTIVGPVTSFQLYLYLILRTSD